MSLSGLPLASFALFSRSMVPPVMNSTSAPVCCLNFLAAVSATRSRQLPPQMLTTSFSCALAGSGSRAIARRATRGRCRFMTGYSFLKAMAHAVVRDAVPTRRGHRRKPGQARQAVCDESLARRLNPSALCIGQTAEGVAHMLLGTRSRDIASSATTIARQARPRRGVAMSIADSAEIDRPYNLEDRSTVRFAHRLGHFRPVCREDGSRL